MSAVIRGSGAVCWPALRCQSFSASIRHAQVGRAEEHAVPLGALASHVDPPRVRSTISTPQRGQVMLSPSDRRAPADPGCQCGTAGVPPGNTASVTSRDRFLPRRPADPEVLAFAHRGGAYHPEIEGLENTLAAFRHAVALGYTLPRDRRPRDPRRRAAGLPRQGARPGHRPPGADRRADPRRGAAALIGGRESVPTLAELFDEFPDGPLQHRPQVRGVRRARRSSSRSARRGTGAGGVVLPRAG